LLVILNAGFGAAKEVACVFKVGNEYCAHRVGSGFLRYKERVRVRTKMRRGEDQRAVVSCRDLSGSVWAWDIQGRCKRYDGAKIGPADSKALWLDFYGEDLGGSESTGSEVDEEA
jgi:hypothetical protein